ncbi:MAG: DUF2087 domain-containing protein [Acidimicrobiia bacterium]|nr:DUF2087 domain-containing protein [Acidimicrobiia bacterium]
MHTETVELSSRRLVGLLAEESRRRVVAALILGADNTVDIARLTGLDQREVMAALDRLITAGLVEGLDGNRYHLLEQAFKRAARTEADPAPASAFPDHPPQRQRILDQCFEGERLVHMPAKHSHRLVVLDHLAQRFEPGRNYSERQANALLSKADPDTASLRRYLVDASLLDRTDGRYRRSGGSFDIG